MRGALVMASLGLAFNLVLWSVPVIVAASTLPHAILADRAPTLAHVLTQSERTDDRKGIVDALLTLLGAEVEAMHVAGVALQPSPPADLGQQADRAGTRVRDALTVYLHVAQDTTRSR